MGKMAVVQLVKGSELAGRCITTTCICIYVYVPSLGYWCGALKKRKLPCRGTTATITV